MVEGERRLVTFVETEKKKEKGPQKEIIETGAIERKEKQIKKNVCI